MTIVADASLAVKWVLEEEHSDTAVALRTRWVQSGELITAPPIFRPEVTNVLHRRVRHGEFDRREARDMLDTLIPGVAIVEPTGLYGRALTLAGELMQTSTYDALYLALAELQGCEVWTADLRFVRAVQARFPQVRSLAEV